MKFYRKQTDEPLTNLDGSWNVYADLTKTTHTILGKPISYYFGWPIVYRSEKGDVWNLTTANSPSCFVIRSNVYSNHEFETLEKAISILNGKSL